MKPQPRRTENLHAHFEADLEARVRALFRCYPALCGFSVGALACGQHLTDVCVHPRAGFTAHAQLCHQVEATIADLLDECPEAGELLRGRTFARVLH